MPSVEPCIDSKEVEKFSSTVGPDFFNDFKIVSEEKESDEESFHLPLDCDYELTRSDEMEEIENGKEEIDENMEETNDVLEETSEEQKSEKENMEAEDVVKETLEEQKSKVEESPKKVANAEKEEPSLSNNTSMDVDTTLTEELLENTPTSNSEETVNLKENSPSIKPDDMETDEDILNKFELPCNTPDSHIPDEKQEETLLNENSDNDFKTCSEEINPELIDQLSTTASANVKETTSSNVEEAICEEQKILLDEPLDKVEECQASGEIQNEQILKNNEEKFEDCQENPVEDSCSNLVQSNNSSETTTNKNSEEVLVEDVSSCKEPTENVAKLDEVDGLAGSTEGTVLASPLEEQNNKLKSEKANVSTEEKLEDPIVLNTEEDVKKATETDCKLDSLEEGVAKNNELEEMSANGEENVSSVEKSTETKASTLEELVLNTIGDCEANSEKQEETMAHLPNLEEKEDANDTIINASKKLDECTDSSKADAVKSNCSNIESEKELEESPINESSAEFTKNPVDKNEEPKINPEEPTKVVEDKMEVNDESSNTSGTDLFDISMIRDTIDDDADAAMTLAKESEDAKLEQIQNDQDELDRQISEEVSSESDKNEAEEQMETEEEDKGIRSEEASLDGALEEKAPLEEENSLLTSELDNSECALVSSSEASNDALAQQDPEKLEEATLILPVQAIKDTDFLEDDDTKMEEDVFDTNTEEVENKPEAVVKNDDHDKNVTTLVSNEVTAKASKRCLSDPAEVDPKKIRLSDEHEIKTTTKVLEVLETVDSKVDTKKEELEEFDPQLRNLLSFASFMKNTRLKKLTRADLEEFCFQKICEAILHKSELGETNHLLQVQEQTIETLRKEQVILSKQVKDLDIVNKKLMAEVKAFNGSKPLTPVKITRSVGLQVRLAANAAPDQKLVLRRQPPTQAVQPKPVQPIQRAAPPKPIQQPNRSPRILTHGNNTNYNSPAAVTRKILGPTISPQKSVQTSPQKPAQSNLLNKALQSPSPNQVRKVGPQNMMRVQNSRTVTPKTPSLVPLQRTNSASSASSNNSSSFIDLTDEDDKRAPTKSGPSPQQKGKSFQGTPLKTVGNAQNIRLTPNTNKLPLTGVTSPSVMYVVPGSGGIQQGILQSPSGTQKTVLVNFQGGGGVLGSQINGQSVSVMSKKTSSYTSTASKHPAPLPIAPFAPQISGNTKPIPPKPTLSIKKTSNGIVLQWKMPYNLSHFETIASYQLYAYQETSAAPTTDMWRKVGDVKAMALPMACTLTQFAAKNKYYFAVRAVDVHKRIGKFSSPEEIAL